MNRRTIITTVLLSSAIGLWAQKKWTLDDCIDYAMQNNITLQQSRINAESSQEDVKAAKAALLPSLSASTNQSVGYTPWTASYGYSFTTSSGGTSSSNGVTKVDKVYYNGSYGLNASWTLWDGNKNINTIRQDKLTAEQAELSAQATANSIQEEIAQLYVQILYLSDALSVSEQSLETSKKNEERGIEMQSVGKMSKADVAQLTAQRASDEYTIVDTRSSIEKAKLQLKQLLELDPGDYFDIVIPQTTNEQALAEIPSSQSVYEQAILCRPEIKNSELGVKSSDIAISMAKAGWMPTLSMTGGVGTSSGSRSDNSYGSQMKSNFDVSAGLTLSIPIYDRRQTRTSVNKARLQYQYAKLNEHEAEHNLRNTIENYWLDAENNQQKFRAAQVTVESEQASYELLSEQFRLGLKNIIELMTGKDKLLKAQRDLLQSKYQTILALQMLRFYRGENIK